MGIKKNILERLPPRLVYLVNKDHENKAFFISMVFAMLGAYNEGPGTDGMGPDAKDPRVRRADGLPKQEFKDTMQAAHDTLPHI